MSNECCCHLLFLPPYSPDLNPIERCEPWSAKHGVSRPR
ncbi:transposase [Piscirickettsia salmonis]|nr:hypothetical protein GW535_05975 [Piscirickettsia salmonis]QIX57001.1 hypothetical protein GW536_08845 [Piscirickettsia salmonis]